MKRSACGGTLALALWAALLGPACQGTGAAPAKAPEVAISKEPATNQVAVEDRAATAFDLLDEDAAIVALLDASALRQGEFFKTLALLSAAVPGLAQSLDDLTSKCGFDPILALTRAGFSADIKAASLHRRTILFTLEVDQPPAAVFSCVQNLASTSSSPSLESTKVRGHEALSFDDEVYLVFGDGVFVFGEKASVERALGRRATGLRLPGDVYLNLDARIDNPFGVKRARFQLGEGAGRLRMSLSADADSRAAAERLVQSAEQGRELVKRRLTDLQLDAGAMSFFKTVVNEVRIEQRGSEASATLDLNGHEAVNALVSAAAAVAVYGVKRYVARAKMAEAHGHVTEIASRLRSHAEGAGQGKFPKSAPLTPASVPRATKVRVPDSAWQHPSWKTIGFSIDEMQYFSYEFVTAKDGKSAVVKAQGDLDGDGQLTLIESTVTVHPDGSTSSTPSVDSSDAPLTPLGAP